MAWEQLLAIKKAAQEEVKEISSCPECGDVLETHPDGRKHCVFCGWVKR